MSIYDNTSKFISHLSITDEYGFQRREDFNGEAYEKFISVYLTVLIRREKKWIKIVRQDIIPKKNAKLKRFVRKGIPLNLRAKVWMAVSGASKLLNENIGYYDKQLKKPVTEEIKVCIDVDMPRTFPDNIHFKVANSPQQTSLKRVLYAYAAHNPSLGYCQGLNYIAGILLIVVKEEEKAFWLLSTLVDRIIPGYHTRDMVGLLTDIHTLGYLIREKKPLIWQHLQFNQIDLTLVVTKWFICVFAEVLPIETILRLWDCIFYEGDKIVMRAALALVLTNEELLFMSQDFVSLIEAFKAIPKTFSVLCCHDFIKTMFTSTGPLPRAHIEQLRKEAHEVVLKQKEEQETKRAQRDNKSSAKS